MQLIVLTDRDGGGAALVPPLGLLAHDVTTVPLSGDLPTLSQVEAVIVDATTDLPAAAQACRVVATHELGPPVLVVAGPATLPALGPTWGFDDWLLEGASAAEVDARLRLVGQRQPTVQERSAHVGELEVDEDSYQVRLRGTPLDLTFKEFELLKTLAAHPDRVFSRDLLLKEVWGYDYFGGSRTIDVHIRRLRAKFGPEHDHLIQTVRGVGYKLVTPE